MTAISSLSDWNQEFGDEDYAAVDKRSQRFQLKIDVAYPVTIRTATLTISQLGEHQIALDMDVRDGITDEKVAEIKDWISLPMQPKTDMSKDKKTVVTLTRIRRNILAVLLGCIDEQRFVPAKAVDTDGDRRYVSWETGEELPRDEFEERQLICNREVLKYAEECHRMLEETDGQDVRDMEDWAGTQLWHSKKENERNVKYPYSRYHREQPTMMPLFRKETNNDTPF